MRIVILLYTLLCIIIPVGVCAQEENAQVVIQGTHYLDLKLKSVEKYNARLEQKQKKLIKKLKRKEERMANRLKRTDSLAYARYKQQPLSYDSIGKLMNVDSATKVVKTKSQKNSITDSLKGIEAFVKSKAGGANTPQLQGYSAEINKQQTELNYHTYINNLITQRTNGLKSMAAQGDIPGFTGIEKQVFYGKAKMNAYKAMQEDPTKAEDKALEYLEGSEGFDQAMKGQGGGAGGMAAGASSSGDLEKMGYQTKSQMQKNLQQKFGGNLGSVAQNVNGQVTKYQDQMNGIKSSINDARQTKNSLSQLKNTSRPSFKVNPMRGLPLFWKRFEKQYNWQTTRATGTGQPATLEASAMMGFKHTPKLVYGVGIASSFGLGQSWSNINFSFQGVGLRSYATWQWQYGIGAYVGYERMYKQAVFIKQPENAVAEIPSPHNTANYNESLLVGLTKSYKLNTKYNGSIQILYDIWWQQKGLNSPFLIRFATLTK